MSKISKRRNTGRTRAAQEGPLYIGDHTVTRDMLTKSQKEADVIFGKWYYSKKSEKEHILRIGGGAGSGKTFLLKYLINSYGLDLSNCYVMAYTGQAVNVLRKNGILANTIHSTIMYVKDEPIVDKSTGKPIYRRGIMLTKPVFVPLKQIPPTIKLMIVDESSFLPDDLERILMRYNVPILEIGDPIQLPPVASKQVFNMETLDYFMDGVMRQDKNSGIFDFATRLRKGQNIDPSKYHDDLLFLHAQDTIEETFYRFYPFFKSADIIITNTNKQRQIITELYREEIIHADSPYPLAGERVICRQNNKQLFLDQYILTNGTIGTVLDDVGRSQIDKTTGTFYMDFQPDVTVDTGLYYDNLPCDSKYFRKPYGTPDELAFKRPGEKFEFAHAITCHLSQGGQYPTVLYMDAFNRDPDYQMRVRYTGATRAEQRLIFICAHSKYPGWSDMWHAGERSARLN